MKHFLNGITLQCSCAKCSRIAQDEKKDREKKIDELQNANEEEIKKQEEKEKELEAYKAEIKDLDDDELDELLESLRAEVHELRKKLHPEETDQDKQSRKASVEFIGADSPAYKSKNGVRPYSVLLFEPYESVTHSGDKLLMRMGSTDSDSISDTSGDELLRKLGSTD